MTAMEDKLNSILENPGMMEKIMSMAKSLQNSGEPERRSPEAGETNIPDLSLLRKMASAAGNTGVDSQQKALLSALTPYMEQDRIEKLQKAMRAAKLAKTATSFLNSGLLSFPKSR